MNDIKGLSHLKFQFTRARTVLTAIAVLKPFAERILSLRVFDLLLCR